MTDFSTLEDLARTIAARKGADPSSSYTAKLFSKGVNKCAQKLGEEAVETVIAATTGNDKEVVTESADLLYHLLVLWAATDTDPAEVMAELARREGTSGLDEKAARPKD